MKKILFPFFDKNRHGFLLNQWWFRAIIVIYVIAAVVIPYSIFGYFAVSSSEWCFQSLYLYHADYNQWQMEKAECNRIHQEALLPSALGAIVITIVGHYLILLIFFKVVVNYIVLGNKK